MTFYTIRAIGTADLSWVAGVHVTAFPASALTGLGIEAIRRYYEWLLQGPHHTTALAAVVDDEPIAFLFGGTFDGALSGFLRRNRRYLALRVLLRPWLVANPLFRDRISTALQIVGKRASRPVAAVAAPAVTESKRAFGILSIAVAPSAQGTGVARALMMRAEDIGRAGGFESMQLTVAASNDRAIAFYLRGGWQKVIRDGQWNGAMTKSLKTENR